MRDLSSAVEDLQINEPSYEPEQGAELSSKAIGSNWGPQSPTDEEEAHGKLPSDTPRKKQTRKEVGKARWKAKQPAAHGLRRSKRLSPSDLLAQKEFAQLAGILACGITPEVGQGQNSDLVLSPALEDDGTTKRPNRLDGVWTRNGWPVLEAGSGDQNQVM
jgi:hypothetical protein